jgi:hypothetical protein
MQEEEEEEGEHWEDRDRWRGSVVTRLMQKLKHQTREEDLFKICLKIIIPSEPLFSKWMLSCKISNQNIICIYEFPHAWVDRYSEQISLICAR